MADNKVREHEYELVAVGTRNESLGTLYWDGKKVTSDNEKLLKRMKSTKIRGPKGRLTLDDGIEFLEALPGYYRSYVSARKVS
jgi:hypothetical protein